MTKKQNTLNEQQLTTEYLTDYTASIKDKKCSWQPSDLLTLPFSSIVKFVHDARQFEVIVITDSAYPDLLKLDKVGLYDESLAEAFLPKHTRKYETMAGHSPRRRILLTGADVINLSFKELVDVVKKSRDFGKKHLADQLDMNYLRSIGFFPIVKDPSKIFDGIITPDNIDGWLPG